MHPAPGLKSSPDSVAVSRSEQRPVTALRGVGAALAEKLARLNVTRVADLLFVLPLRYEDRTQVTAIGALTPGVRAAVEGEVQLTEVAYRGRRQLLCRISDGSGMLTIRTSHDEEFLSVAIGDTGPGVPEEIRSRIFETFFTTKPFGEGTGLGLDISWRIVVNKHHGDLRLESSPGDTWFVVRLPLTEPARLDGPETGEPTTP